MNNLKNTLIAVILALGIGYAFGRYKTPQKVEIQEREKIVKQTEVIVREVKQADGTVIKETITKDTSKKENDKSNKTQNAKSKYLISATAGYSFVDKKENYGAAVQMRLGDTPFFGGVYGNTQRGGGIILSIEL